MKIGVIYNQYAYQLIDFIFSISYDVDLSIIHSQSKKYHHDVDLLLVREPKEESLLYLNQFHHSKQTIIISEYIQSSDYPVYTYYHFKSFIKSLLQNKELICSYKNQKVAISFTKIIFITKHVNKCEVYTAKIKHPFNYFGSLANVEKELPNYFIKINRSDIVNMNYVKEIKREIITLQNGHKLYISRRKITVIHERYLHFQFYSSQ